MSKVNTSYHYKSILLDLEDFEVKVGAHANEVDKWYINFFDRKTHASVYGMLFTDLDVLMEEFQIILEKRGAYEQHKFLEVHEELRKTNLARSDKAS